MKYKILTGAALRKYLKAHPRVALTLKRAHITALRVKVRVQSPANRAKRALALATHFIGTKEYPAGSNLTVFGKWYGENGVAWCAIFVSYILSHTGTPFKQAYVPTIVAMARAKTHGFRVVPASAVNGLIAKGVPVLVCYDWTGDGTADHVGLAKQVVAGTIHAVEGNTGDSNWSNGGEVWAATRPLSLVQAFVAVGG